MFGVQDRDDYYQWSKSTGMILPRDDLVTLWRENEEEGGEGGGETEPKRTSFLVVDCRDEDHAGGHIRGSLHLPDSSDWATAMPLLLREIEAKKANVVIFHCMESIRRGPRCARRLHNYYCENKNEVAPPSLRILQGGADQWMRRFYRDERYVDGYDNDYWGFDKLSDEEEDKEKEVEEEKEKGKGRNDKTCSMHSLYSRPSNQEIDSCGREISLDHK